MASVRNLKKDIDMLMSLVLNDCFYVLEYNTKVDSEAVMDIAGEIIRKHRELRKAVNHPGEKGNPKQVKSYYKQLSTRMLAFVDESFEKLSAEVKKTV